MLIYFQQLARSRIPAIRPFCPNPGLAAGLRSSAGIYQSGESI